MTCHILTMNQRFEKRRGNKRYKFAKAKCGDNLDKFTAHLRDHSFSMYAKISEKLISFTP